MARMRNGVSCERVGDGWVVLGAGGLVHNVTGLCAEVLDCVVDRRPVPEHCGEALAALVDAGIVTDPHHVSRRAMMVAGAAAVGLTSVALPASVAAASPVPPPAPAAPVPQLPLPNGESFLFPAGNDEELGYLVANNDPAQVISVFLPVMASVNVLSLDEGETLGGAVATDGEFLYLGTDAAPAKVVKIRLFPLERVDTLTLWPGENSLRSAVVAGGSGYFVTGTDPAVVIRVNLATMSREGSYTLLGSGGATG